MIKLIKNFFLLLISVYQFFSGYTPKSCRFYPTCSEYTKQAIIKYGLLKGVKLGFFRIIKCHPFNYGGYDPVP